ncbi:MAG: hypothetical protein DWQ08_08015 [Proteobacteria bacterium]|nr:MAG: hypothetical protein DWQ08_08015 [Pseudomonadota bacterium]
MPFWLTTLKRRLTGAFAAATNLTYVERLSCRAVFSAYGVRHNLTCLKDHLDRIQAKVAEGGVILAESQIAALEKKPDDEAFSENETAHPGYLGSQDTLYIGTQKGEIRMCQRTCVDTY